jgi:hypothetical protein
VFVVVVVVVVVDLYFLTEIPGKKSKQQPEEQSNNPTSCHLREQLPEKSMTETTPLLLEEYSSCSSNDHNNHPKTTASSTTTPRSKSLSHITYNMSTETTIDQSDPPTTTTNNGESTTTQTLRRRMTPASPFKAIQNMRRKRRSRSAPPKLRKPLIEQHFRVSKEVGSGRTEVLPGLLKHEDDWARDTHDFFNLIVLIPIVALNVMNWNWEILMNLQKKQTVADAWTGEWFDMFFWATLGYFVADLSWICIIPNSVKSPSVIIQHHVATMLYILIPYNTPAVRWCMGACMSVEVNTWFLIARRVFNKQGYVIVV